MGGLVSLVGAGPGDPELLTLRALARLQQAEAIVHDRLVGPEILALGRPEARRYDVGKVPGGHRWRQEEINDLLIRLARAGLRVVRLKGGDPFVFGRGGEEALALTRAGVPFEIVPGISSALAAPAVAGIPVTHRGLAAAVAVTAGHCQSGGADPDWTPFARLPGTLVVLMAVENLERVVAGLLGAGRPADEPAALVEAATMRRQRTIQATLATIVPLARAARVAPPATLVIGPTVALRAQLQAEPAAAPPALMATAAGAAR